MYKIKTETSQDGKYISTFLKDKDGRDIRIGNLEGEIILSLQDKIFNYNIQIKDLKAQINTHIYNKDNLHSRIDVLEKIVKENGLWEQYCVACDNNK